MIRLKDIADKVQGTLIGDGLVTISGIASIEEAKAGDITFLVQKSFKKYLKQSQASAIIVGEDIDRDQLAGKSVIISKNPGLAYVKVAAMFQQETILEKGVSPRASVAASADVAPDATVCPFAFIGEKAIIGKNAIIHPFVHVGNGVTVGEDTVIHPHAVIYDRAFIGKRVIIHGGAVIGSDGFGYIWDGARHVKIPQIGIVEVEDDVEIGANVAIDRASLGKTVIGRGTKIDNLVQIAHNVSIGENSIIISQVGIAGSTTVGKNVILAGQVGVRDHVAIGDNVRAAGGTGITKDVPAGSLISGTPHMPHRDWLKLQTYIKNLPKLYDKMKRVEQKLRMEADSD